MDPSEAALRYRAALDQLAALGEGTPETQRWNQAAHECYAAHLVLRASPEGRQAIEACLRHPEPTARSWAAAHAIMWNEADARPVLEALVAAKGLTGFTAKMVLSEFDAGRLHHDWSPDGPA